jgi:hypothetical protein
MFNLPDDGCDATFWAACYRAEQMLVEGVRAMGPTPRRDGVFELFTTAWPKGLCKMGALLHPQQASGEYTWISHASMLDERKYYRWQRDAKLVFPAQPEIYEY